MVSPSNPEENITKKAHFAQGYCFSA